MKTNYLFLAFSLVAMTLASCSDEVDDVLDSQDEQITSLDSIFTYDMYFDSEITSYDGTTRATTASDWEDGDIVYLYFMGINDAYGKAEYISSSKKWRITCEKALVEAFNNQCSVWYGNGINPSVGSSSLGDYTAYSYLTEAYSTQVGQYTFSNNSIYIKATMEPIGWRLRFKGIVGTQINLYDNSGKWGRYKGIFSNGYGGFDSSEDSFSLTVGSDGYTDYFIGYTNSSCTSITFRNNSTTPREVYTRYFDSNTLKEGESGCFTIPTSSNLYGWTKK